MGVDNELLIGFGVRRVRTVSTCRTTNMIACPTPLHVL